MMASTQVIISGAGPTGLIMAIWLRKKGISVRIFDKSSQPGTTSRAIAVQARTLEFYRQLGIADRLLELGITVPEIVMRRKGNVVATAKLGALGKGISPYPYLLFCSQDVHEELLCDVLKELGTEVERNCELVEFNQDNNNVQAFFKTPSGKLSVTGAYLCGCDGAHSFVRHALDFKFTGGTYSQTFFVADVHVKDPTRAQGLQISVGAKDFCIIMPIKSKGTIRLTGLVPPENENKEIITYDDVKESVAKNTGLEITNVNWFSPYHVHHRVAEHFRRGRAFICGDAGHIHSPAGGQGMNTGIGDAINLAWKLADVLNGKRSAKILDSYELERMAFAKTLVSSTDTAFKVIASRNLVGSIFRAYILPGLFARLARLHTFLTVAFKTVSQVRIQYHDSFLSEGHTGTIKAGSRLPWVQFVDGDNYNQLRSMNWQMHIYGTLKFEFKKFLDSQNIEIFVFPYNKDAREKGFIENGSYFIRPDGYISFASEFQNVREFQDFYWSLL